MTMPLRALGYDGGYDAIRRYARSWAKLNAKCDGGMRWDAEIREVVGVIAHVLGSLGTQPRVVSLTLEKIIFNRLGRHCAGRRELQQT